MSRRTERVADLVRAEIARLLAREVRDPRVGLASVSAVEISRDLRHAVVRVSVLGEETARQASIEALVHARGFIRSRLAQGLKLKVVPELSFELDRGAEYSQRISDLLESLDDRDEST